MNGWTLLRSQVHLLQQKRTPSRVATLFPLVGGAWSPAGVSHVREWVGGWVGELCVLGCARDWVCCESRVRARAEAAAGGWGGTQAQHLKRRRRRSKIDVSEGFWDEVLPLKEADPP